MKKKSTQPSEWMTDAVDTYQFSIYVYIPSNMRNTVYLIIIYFK